MTALRIHPYEAGPAAFHVYDPRWPQAAALLIESIERQEARLRADHIGSTSVPECGGKGVIDLAVTYLTGDLEIAKSALAALGFQPQTGGDPFPETRPMREANVSAFGSRFNVHAHVIVRHGEEHGTLLAFRDALRRDAELRLGYEAEKQRILAAGITDRLQYCNAKGEFITATLATLPRRQP
jgi:GrpB-like predicted nucleotidyltransferase (UPF0157 family)